MSHPVNAWNGGSASAVFLVLTHGALLLLYSVFRQILPRKKVNAFCTFLHRIIYIAMQVSYG